MRRWAPIMRALILFLAVVAYDVSGRQSYVSGQNIPLPDSQKYGLSVSTVRLGSFQEVSVMITGTFPCVLSAVELWVLDGAGHTVAIAPLLVANQKFKFTLSNSHRNESMVALDCSEVKGNQPELYVLLLNENESKSYK